MVKTDKKEGDREQGGAIKKEPFPIDSPTHALLHTLASQLLKISLPQAVTVAISVSVSTAELLLVLITNATAKALTTMAIADAAAISIQFIASPVTSSSTALLFSPGAAWLWLINDLWPSFPLALVLSSCSCSPPLPSADFPS